jgi:hypothetical protein
MASNLLQCVWQKLAHDVSEGSPAKSSRLEVIAEVGSIEAVASAAAPCGSLAMLAAIRRASSRVISLVAARRLGSSGRTKSKRPPEAHMRRYVVRRQENRQYCICDTKTDQPAEADGRRYVNLQFDEALNFVELLNGAKNSN